MTSIQTFTANQQCKAAKADQIQKYLIKEFTTFIETKFEFSKLQVTSQVTLRAEKTEFHKLVSDKITAEKGLNS